MPQFLTFTLSAPLGAMGELAVGERRDSAPRPARSALLGLIGACLGLDRADEAAQLALEAGYNLATATQSGRQPLLDYHTAQVPSRQRGVTFATRREELADKLLLNTILSQREYRSDLRARVAVWARGEPRWSLGALEQALRTPHFIPYFGRKSCPLDRPMAPRLREAKTPRAALEAHAADPAEARLHGLVGGRNGLGDIAMDAAEARAFGLDILRIERRRDQLASRGRWQFDLREEAILA
jgi:CRISPR system Cascade subunit CasD